ncbi:MAG: serine/threonine protein kinase, partial [Ktedonobacteraceae bacterium]
ASFTDTENWYLMMEYIQGQTLEEYQQKQPDGHLSESETAQIGQNLARILQNLHQFFGMHIVFRDVKPANIMITPDRKLYLIDFGITRIFKQGKRKDTTPLGSPGYAPPEQYGRAQTDGRADIYSLGVTLQTLHTGRDPLDLAQGEPARNPRQLSRPFHTLLTAMLEADAARRPTTMQEVSQRLGWIAALGYGNKLRASLSTTLGVFLSLFMMMPIAMSASVMLQGLGFLLFFVWIGLGGLIIGVNTRRKHAGKKSIDGLFFSIGFGIGFILGVVIILIILFSMVSPH